jgi:hypothetical protein
MKLSLSFFCLVVLIVSSCNVPNYQPATTALEGGREFIQAYLAGDFDKASFYMINDNINNSDLLKIKRDYDSKSADEKHSYATASIIINSDETINDSTHIINYANSYDKIAHKVKVINRNQQWLVDFKYTFNGNL